MSLELCELFLILRYTTTDCDNVYLLVLIHVHSQLRLLYLGGRIIYILVVILRLNSGGALLICVFIVEISTSLNLLIVIWACLKELRV
jgi:hypothetical protein